MPDIFISYAREDRDTAERLAQALEAEGWSVWWDRHIPAGKRFDEVISESLESARCIIVLWSEAAIASQWVAEEAEEGKERAALVPAMIEAVEPPLGFRRIQAADLIGWSGDRGHPGLRQLIGDIRRVVGAGAQPSAAASQSPAGRPSGPATGGRRLPLLLAGGAVAAAVAAGAILLTSPERSGGSPNAGVAHTVTAAGAGTPTAAVRLDGRWQGRVNYDWGPTIDETFTFRTVGQTLTGSAGFLGVGRGIVDPRLDGSEVRFAVRWHETLGSEQRQVINQYVGAVSNNHIDMVLSIDGSASAHPPIAFTLTRVPD